MAKKASVKSPQVPDLPRVEVDKPHVKKQNFSKVRDDKKYVFAHLPQKQHEKLNRLAPQCKALINLLNPENLEKEMTEPEIYKVIEENQEIFKSRQHFWRIFQYYRSSLISHGFFRAV